MRTLALTAATAGLVLLPSAAYAGDVAAPGAIGVPARLSASCNAAATTTTSPIYLTFVIHAEATSNVGVSTSVRCQLRGGGWNMGGVSAAMPGPVVVTAGIANAPLYAFPFELCYSASAVFPDGSTASLPTVCEPF